MLQFYAHNVILSYENRKLLYFNMSSQPNMTIMLVAKLLVLGITIWQPSLNYIR